MKRTVIKLKKVREIPGFCGPASLESLLHYYGVNLSQKQIAKLVHAKKYAGTSDFGTNHKDIIAALKKLGFSVVARDHGTWQELKKLTEKGIPVLVGWFTLTGVPDDHFSLAYKVTNQHVYLMDPEIAKTRKMSKEKFLGLWWDMDTPKNYRVDKWSLYIQSKKR